MPRDPTVFTDPAAYRAFLTAPSPALGAVSSGEPATLTVGPKGGANADVRGGFETTEASTALRIAG